MEMRKKAASNLRKSIQEDQVAEKERKRQKRTKRQREEDKVLKNNKFDRTSTKYGGV